MSDTKATGAARPAHAPGATPGRTQAGDAPARESPPALVTLVNCRSQPVELYLAGEVRVLLPAARTQLAAAALELPQIRHLISHKALSIAPPAVTHGEDDAAAAEPVRHKTAAPAARPATAASAHEPHDRHAADTRSKRAPSGAGQPASSPASVKPKSKGEKA